MHDPLGDFFGGKRKGGHKWGNEGGFGAMDMGKGLGDYMRGGDLGGGLGNYMKGLPDIGSDFGKYVSTEGVFHKKMKSKGSLDYGVGLGMGNIGDDYMDYVSKAGGLKSENFMSYLEAGTPKAFKTIGKEPKSISKRRFADKTMELEYGAESIGFATEGLERNIHRSAKSTLARAKASRDEIQENVGNFKKNVKEGRLGFEEDSVGGRLVTKVKQYKGRREAKKEVKSYLDVEKMKQSTEQKEEEMRKIRRDDKNNE